MDAARRDKLMNDFYRSGTPEQAVEALAHLVGTPDFAAQGEDALHAAECFFKAVARRHPAAAAGYRALAVSSAAGRRFIEQVLDPSRDEAMGPIRTGLDLDQRWTEFLVSGDPTLVREIVAVLGWPDRLRARIEGYLHERRFLDTFFDPAKRRRRLLQKLAPLGVRSDASGTELATPQDLDCLVLMQGLRVVADKARVLQEALPTRLEAPDLIYMSTKATAKWSLCSNAQSHPAVLAVCTEALATATGSARLSLLEIVAEAGLPSERAVAAAEEYLTFLPGHAEMTERLQRARELARINRRHALLDPDAADPGSPRPESEAAALCRRALEAAAGRRCYRLNLRVRNHLQAGFPSRDGLASEWELAVVGTGAGKDRFSGRRWFWDSESQQALADLWISIGEEHYENPTFWVRFPKPIRAEVHRGLVAEAYLQPLSACAAAQISEHTHDGQRYLRLRFSGVPLPEVAAAIHIESVPCDVELWTEAESGLPAAVRVRARRQPPQGEPLDQELRQVFMDYDAAIEISRPESIVEIPASSGFGS